MSDELSVTVQDVMAAALTLSREDRQKLQQLLNSNLRSEVMASFYPGDKVKFKARSGVTIEGLVIRVNAKSVKVSSSQDRYGQVNSRGKVTWTVSPQFIQAA